MKGQAVLKIIAGTATVLGIGLGFFERRFAPHARLTEDSPNYPDWLGWLGWILASVAALVYIAIDVIRAIGSTSRAVVSIFPAPW